MSRTVVNLISFSVSKKLQRYGVEGGRIGGREDGGPVNESGAGEGRWKKKKVRTRTTSDNPRRRRRIRHARAKRIKLARVRRVLAVDRAELAPQVCVGVSQHTSECKAEEKKQKTHTD
jgi:hypothetical protein